MSAARCGIPRRLEADARRVREHDALLRRAAEEEREAIPPVEPARLRVTRSRRRTSPAPRRGAGSGARRRGCRRTRRRSSASPGSGAPASRRGGGADRRATDRAVRLDHRELRFELLGPRLEEIRVELAGRLGIADAVVGEDGERARLDPRAEPEHAIEEAERVERARDATPLRDRDGRGRTSLGVHDAFPFTADFAA